MPQQSTAPDELERRLAELHEASFGWACACCAWNETEAEDVLQTTYLKVISGRARFEGRSSFRTWLFGVIRLTAREQARSVRRRQSRTESLGQGPEPEARGVPADEVVARAEQARLLRSALDELPERQQEVLNLVFYQDLTLREAAEVMDVSIGSVRVHYDRGKKKLRALLAHRDLG
jgi:RNA polymerase sigma-70 factor (ECF subfamily)